jgi:chromosomal replication initiation ATPase DnaA
MHLVLSDELSLHQEVIYAPTTNAAIALLATGTVTQISFVGDWLDRHDPDMAVVHFLDQAVRTAAIPMVTWAILGEHHATQGILLELVKYCQQRGAERPLALEVQDHAIRCGLNTEQTFEQFNCTPDNAAAFAYATLASLSQGPERNPLLIMGPSGSGKSHLLNAIGLGRLRYEPGTQILRIPASAFLSPQTLDRRLVTMDLLLIDDLQDLAGHNVAQDLLHIAGETLRIRGRQIVLSSHSAANELPNMNRRMLDYLAKGAAVTCHVNSGSALGQLSCFVIESRKRYLKQQAEASDVPLVDDVSAFLAAQPTLSIRDLPNVLRSLQAHAIFHQRPANIALATEVLRIWFARVSPEKD